MYSKTGKHTDSRIHDLQLAEFMVMVAEMRFAQNDYFKNRGDKYKLKLSIAKEAKVDNAIDQAIKSGLIKPANSREEGNFQLNMF